jgi:hypothetical protein
MNNIGVPASAAEGKNNDNAKNSSLVDTPSKKGEFGSKYL